MGARFKSIDREQPFLMPPDLKEWLPANHIVHFTIEAANMVPLDRFVVNERGSGDEQYHPQMLLALLLYCYSHGIFSSRRIEQASWSDVAVRYICANRHPDHDTICTFRVRNRAAIEEAFLRMLLLAKELKVLKLGTVSVDGSKIKANASIHKSIRYDRARELEQELRLEIDELLKRAESEDKVKDERGDEVGAELERLSDLRAKMRTAQDELEKRAKDRAEREREEYEKKVLDRNDRNGKGKGRSIKEPKDKPEDTEQANLTDADSRIMRKNRRSEYIQAYNAQAVVDAEGTMLIVASRVTNNTGDANELVHDVDAIPEAVGSPVTVLADKGYANEAPVRDLQARSMTVLVPVSSESVQSPRRHDFRPGSKAPYPKTEKPYELQWVKDMRSTMTTDVAKKLYRLRKQSVEPVFGIIKQALGFRQFLLRGIGKVELEWKLVTCAYNLKRLFALR
jgi:transposase